LEQILTEGAKIGSSSRAVVLTGLAGRGIMSSRSPWLHEREAEALGVRLTYDLFDFDVLGWTDARLEYLLAEAQDKGFAGLNITFPFKQAVVEHLDELSDGARRIGAVNTVSFAGGKRTGYNTDVTGFAESFVRGLPDAELGCALQIGAGGAGSATAQALLESGVGKILLFDTDAVRVNDLALKLKSDFGNDRAHVANDICVAAKAADGIVNATPIGMTKLPGLPIPAACIEPRHWVADIVYFPLETELLVQAKQRGCKTLNGGGMAINQAAEAFEIFTGLIADRSRMERSFVDFVDRRLSQIR
jgi:shikimate dehydrogenase